VPRAFGRPTKVDNDEKGAHKGKKIRKTWPTKHSIKV